MAEVRVGPAGTRPPPLPPGSISFCFFCCSRIDHFFLQRFAQRLKGYKKIFWRFALRKKRGAKIFLMLHPDVLAMIFSFARCARPHLACPPLRRANAPVVLFSRRRGKGRFFLPALRATSRSPDVFCLVLLATAVPTKRFARKKSSATSHTARTFGVTNHMQHEIRLLMRVCLPLRRRGALSPFAR